MNDITQQTLETMNALIKTKRFSEDKNLTEREKTCIELMVTFLNKITK